MFCYNIRPTLYRGAYHLVPQCYVKSQFRRTLVARPTMPAGAGVPLHVDNERIINSPLASIPARITSCAIHCQYIQ